jgi:purine nucleoside phosphorylase
MAHAIGVLGGSGFYDVPGFETIELDTPFGRPSDVVSVGRLAGRRVVFLPRHGRGHELLPTGSPLSTTHVSTGAIVGAGTASAGAIDWRTVRGLLLAWIVTLPLAALLAVCAYGALRLAGS